MSGEPIVDVVGQQFGLGLRGGFGVLHLVLHAVEGGGVGLVAHGPAGVGGLAESARAAMLGDEHIAFGLRLHQLLLEFEERALEVLHLRFLIFHLLAEAFGHGLVAHGALHGGARQGIVLLIHGQLGAADPLLGALLVFLELALQDVLVGDGYGYLGLDLE